MDLTTLSLDELLGLDFSEFEGDALTALENEIRSRFAAIKAASTPTRKDIKDAQALAALLPTVRTAAAALADSEKASEDEVAGLAELSLDEPEGEGDEDSDEDEGDESDEDESDEGDGDDADAEGGADDESVEATTEEGKKVAASTKTGSKRKVTARLAGTRPAVVPVDEKSLITITAAADTQYATGSDITLADVGQAAIHRLKGLPEPNGDGTTEDLRFFPIANMAIEFPEDLTVTARMSDEAIHDVLAHAGDESRLEGNSLVASAGWCAPSEIMYDLPNNEVVDGILSIPEVQVNRGGFKHTTGIDWSTLYSGVGFLQTEAQAISGTSKTCYEVPCPTFTDERLDAIGLCLKVPILLESGYPEMVTNITARSMVAHQYKVNASVISRIQTYAGSARNFTVDLGSSVADTLSGVNLVMTQLRQKYRIGSTATLEVMFPVWAKEVFREDLSNRTGRPTDAVTDAEILAHFAVRHAAPQFVYGYQELTTTDLIWPAAVEFIAWPAGTFVKGVSNVINLSAVYDAASLVVNIYTGLFMEQGLLVAKMNYEAVRATVPTCQAGRTGAANLTCS